MIDYVFWVCARCSINWLIFCSSDGTITCTVVSIWLPKVETLWVCTFFHLVFYETWLLSLAFQEELSLPIALYVMNVDTWARIVLKILVESIQRFTNFPSWCLSFQSIECHIHERVASFQKSDVLKNLDDVLSWPCTSLICLIWHFSIYFPLLIPQGGCCKICGGVTHLAKDCPNKGYRGSVAAAGAGYTCKF